MQGFTPPTKLHRALDCLHGSLAPAPPRSGLHGAVLQQHCLSCSPPIKSCATVQSHPRNCVRSRSRVSAALRSKQPNFSVLRRVADGDQLRGHPETLLETGWQGLDLTFLPFEQAGGSPGLHDSPFAAQTVQCSPTFSCSYTLVTAPGPALRACPWEEEACVVRNLKQHSLTADTPTPSGGDPCARPRPSIQKSHRQVYPGDHASPALVPLVLYIPVR